MTRVFVADDHPIIRTALEILLRDTRFTIVGTAATGERTLSDVDELNPDLLLLDIRMPGGDGMDVLRRLKARGAKLPIVMLTAGLDDSSLLEAHALGAEGLVLKNSDPAYLLDCLETVSRGEKWLDPELRDRIRQLTGGRARSEKTSLAPRELQIISFVRLGLRNREIAERLGVTEGTVKVYLHAVFEKLGVSNRTELAIRADEFLAGDAGDLDPQ